MCQNYEGSQSIPTKKKAKDDRFLCYLKLFLGSTHPSRPNSPFSGRSRDMPPWVGEEVGVWRQEDSPSVPLDSTPVRAKDERRAVIRAATTGRLSEIYLI